MTSSMKYGAPVEIRKEKILFPLKKAHQMLNEPLQIFLNRFTDYSTPDINFLHLRTITSVFSKLGYTLEENLPPIKRPGLSDISLFAYLQITEPQLSNNIFVLNLEEFNDLVSKVVYQQLGAFQRFFRPQSIFVEEYGTLRTWWCVIQLDSCLIRSKPQRPQPHRCSFLRRVCLVK